MDVSLTELSLPRTRYGGRNPVKTIVYWMPPGESRDHTGMTVKRLIQSFLN
jgi:hypothetical protein